jgi:hypothetical protein
MVLPDHLGEALRPQPVGQGMRRLRRKQRAHRPVDMGGAALACKGRD